MKTLKELYKDLWADEKLVLGFKLLVVYSLIAIFIIPFILTQPWFYIVDYNKTGAVGDTINGIAGPFIAVLAAALTFLAFWVQYQANAQQRNDLKVERFENKFYELLRLHRANLDEMNIADRVKGRKCFIRLFNELKYCYMIANDQYNAATAEEKKLYESQPINLLKFAYTVFFYGIGVLSEKQFLHNFSEAEKNLYKDCKKVMSKFQNDYAAAKAKNSKIKYFTFDLPLSEIPDNRTKYFYYKPFDGHADLLGHYYRHLYQSVSYIVGQKDNYFTDEVKYSYVKTLRAQLSNHEQLMLYYNSTSWFNDEWKEYFTDFRLIKNLPLGLADFGIKPEVKYEADIARLAAKGITMFELHE